MADEVGRVVWFTGLSGAGKSTLAGAVAECLRSAGHTAEVIDGDDLRQRLSAGLGFSWQDRRENARRAACLALELARHCDFVLVALITPYRAVRDEISMMLPTYFEVFVNAPLAVCEARDPKGLYRRARAGELTGFTGVDDPYEPPEHPALEVRTDECPAYLCAAAVVGALTGGESRGRKLAALLASSFEADPGISMAEFARRTGASARTVAAHLAEEGVGFRELRKQKLLAAAQRLLAQSQSVKEVAFALKFSSPESFEHFYRRATGHCPSQIFELRRQHG